MTNHLIETFQHNLSLGVLDVGKQTLARLEEEDFENMELLARKLNNQIDALLRRAQTIRIADELASLLDLLASFGLILN